MAQIRARKAAESLNAAQLWEQCRGLGGQLLLGDKFLLRYTRLAGFDINDDSALEALEIRTVEVLLCV